MRRVGSWHRHNVSDTTPHHDAPETGATQPLRAKWLIVETLAVNGEPDSPPRLVRRFPDISGHMAALASGMQDVVDAKGDLRRDVSRFAQLCCWLR